MNFIPNDKESFPPSPKQNFANATASDTNSVNLYNKLKTYFGTPGVTWSYLYSRLPGSQAYLANPSNATGIVYAYNTLGDPSQSLNYNGNNNMLIWYYTAYYANLYPLPADVQDSCSDIATMQNALQNELVSSDKIYVSDNNTQQHIGRTTAINSLLSQLNSMYANLNCDTYIAQQQAAAEAAATAASLAASQQSQVSTYQAVTTTPAAGSNVALYAVVGVGIVITLMVIYKMVNKKKE